MFSSKITKVVSLCVLVPILSSCNPVMTTITTVPAAFIGVYDQSEKRNTWHKYAESGDVYAQYELAMSYCCNKMEGKINSKEAFKWFCKAGKNGYAKAQVALGKIYENTGVLEGISVPKDNARAHMWYSLAANRLNGDGILLRNAVKEIMSEQEVLESRILITNSRGVPCGLK